MSVQRTRILSVMLSLFLFHARPAQAGPATAPSTQPSDVYRQFVAATRAGDERAATALWHAKNPDEARGILAYVRTAIVVEQIKREMVRQFGPEPAGPDGWDMGLPRDEYLADAAAKIEGDRATVDWAAEDALGGRSGRNAKLIRVDGQWKLVPDNEEENLDQKDVQLSEITLDAARASFAKLKAKGFKAPSEVSDDILREMYRIGRDRFGENATTRPATR
jgi:hypothetical protein